MNNPFDENDDAFKDDRERWERERVERERLEAEQRALEEGDASGIEDAEIEDVDPETTDYTDADYDEPDQLRLGDAEEERLPWLESDDEDGDEVVDTARIALVTIIGLLAVLSIVGLAWWLSRDKPDEALLAEGSTIEAPADPARARPEQPGGEPVEGTGDVSFAVGEGQEAAPAPAASAAPTPAATATAVAAAAAPVAGAAGAAAAPRPSIDRAQASAPASGNGGIAVQVGAYSTRASAEAGWNQLTRQHSALQGAANRIQQAQVDGNTVFRLQALSGSAAAADQLCRAIKSGGGDCRVVN